MADPCDVPRRGALSEGAKGFSRKLFLGEGPWGNLVAGAGLLVALGLVVTMVVFMALTLPALPLPGGGN